jgi:hypothetical protein
MGKNDLTNIDVALFALLQLNGFEKRVHTEQIAYRAFELDPARFSWRLAEFRDKQFPDKEPVRIALMDAAKVKYGALVDGRSGVEASGKDADGWILTPAGAKWIREREASITRRLGLDRSQLRQKETARFIKQLKSQPLFQKFKENRDLMSETQFAFTDMLNVSPDASRAVVSKKFLRLRSIAELAGDEDVREFLEVCSQKFSGLLGKIRIQGDDEEDH